MNNVTRNDFLFFQNEILRDMKTVDIKINEKISELTNEVKLNYTNLQQNFNTCQEQITKILESIDFDSERQKIKEMLSKFQKKVDDSLITDRTKISTIERELSNSTFKYDKLISSNLLVPGIVGISCPYPTLAHFVEFVNKKLNELILEKQKQNFEYKTYKEKMETLINTSRDQMKNSYSIFSTFCQEKFTENDKQCQNRFLMIDEKINNMRLENGKYSSDLIEKTKELTKDLENMHNIRDEINQKLEDELEKFKKSNSNLVKIFNNQHEEFEIIKTRFTELSQFIKDVRFRSNINKNVNSKIDIQDYDNPNSFYEKKKKFSDMSRRINFNHKQKLDVIEDLNYNVDENKNSNVENDNKLLNNRSKISDKDKDSDNSVINNTTTLYISKNSKKKIKNNKKTSFRPLDKPIYLKNIQSTYKNYINSSKNNIKINKIHKNININEEKERSSTAKKDKGMNTNIDTQENKDSSVTIANNKEKFNQNQDMLCEINENNNLENNIKNNNKNTIDNKKNNISSLSDNFKTADMSKTFSILMYQKKNKSKFIDYKDEMNQSFVDINDKDISENANNKMRKCLSPDNTKNDKERNNLQIEIPKNNNTSAKSRDKNDNNYLNYLTDNMSNDEKTISDKNKISLYTEKYKIGNNKSTNKILKFNKINADFNFITNPDINKNINVNKNDNLDNFEYYYEELSKKIIETNKNINDIYNKLNKKIHKIMGILMGKKFMESNGNNNIFNFDFSPKNIFTASDMSLPLAMSSNKKEKNIYSRNLIYLDKNKNFSPIRLKNKVGSYKTLLNKVEPFLIKKFKE